MGGDTCYLLDLPYEVLHGILREVDLFSLGPLTETCSSLNKFIKSNKLLLKELYLKTFDDPQERHGADFDWEAVLIKFIRLHKILLSTQTIQKTSNIEFISEAVCSMLKLAHFSEADSQPSTSADSDAKQKGVNGSGTKETVPKVLVSRNVTFLTDLFAQNSNVEEILCASSLFDHLATDTNETPTVEADGFGDADVDLVAANTEETEDPIVTETIGRVASMNEIVSRMVDETSSTDAALAATELAELAAAELDELAAAEIDELDESFSTDMEEEEEEEEELATIEVDESSSTDMDELDADELDEFTLVEIDEPSTTVTGVPYAVDVKKQLSAKLHCLYGVPVGASTQDSNATHPYARAKVYDIRLYTERTMWGPFTDDGSQNVDWEKVEAVMVDLAYNVELFHHRVNGQFPILWSTPWRGAVPYSYFCAAIPNPANQPSIPLASQDPYNISGTWMRIVCFLDYRDFFAYNFASQRAPVGENIRPINTEEAIRIICMKFKVTKIEPPGESDGKDLPIVHFAGTSHSLHAAWDPNANSDIRGTVKLTPEGEVRWTTFSIYSGEERWRTEAIQVGGVQSRRGVFGHWFDKDYDARGPAGPTAFWKLTDQIAEGRQHQFHHQ